MMETVKLIRIVNQGMFVALLGFPIRRNVESTRESVGSGEVSDVNQTKYVSKILRKGP